MYRYAVYSRPRLFREDCLYGISVQEHSKTDGQPTTLAMVFPFSNDYEDLRLIAESCTATQLPPEEVLDVVTAYLELCRK